MKNSLLFLISFLLIFLLILGLTFNGNIHFGNGLGDLIYLFLAGAMSISNFVLLFTSIRKLKNNKSSAIFVLILNTGALLYLIYSFTIGRGIERPWDGTIFF